MYQVTNIYCVLGTQLLAQGYLINALKMSRHPSPAHFPINGQQPGLTGDELGTKGLLSPLLFLSLYPSTSIADPIVVR